MGKLGPDSTKMKGSAYSRIFCCCAMGPSSAEAGMFLKVSWRWLKNVVATIVTISTAAIHRVAGVSVPRKVSESCAPKSVASLACSRSVSDSSPMGSASSCSR